MASRGHPLGEIEHCRNEALIFARSNNLGHLLKTSLELMNSVIASGLHSKTLPLKVQALLMECASMHDEDPNREDDLAMLHYGVTSTVCALLTSLCEKGDTERATSANQQRVEEIEQWRNKALHYSRSDKLGEIIKNTLELMQTVIATGLRSQTLPIKLQALSMECESAIADDPNREDRSRTLHYGVIFAICTLLEAMTAKENETPAINKAPVRGVRKVRFDIEEDLVSPSCINNPSHSRDASSLMDGTNRETNIQERRPVEITSPEEVAPHVEELTESPTKNVKDTIESGEERPPLTYREMIVDALENSETKQLSNAQIEENICENYPYYRINADKVTVNVRTCLYKLEQKGIVKKSTMGNGLAMWSMYHQKEVSPVQENCDLENAVDAESSRKEESAIADNHSINKINPDASKKTTRSSDFDWMNAVDMTNFGENISPIMDQQVRIANFSADASPFVDHSSTSMLSQDDKESRAHAVAGSTTSAFVDCMPTGVDNNEAEIENQKADTYENEDICERPSKNFREMITEVLQSRPAEHLSTAQIAKSIRDQYPYYRDKYTERMIKNNCNTTLSRNFQKINSDTHALWTIRSEDSESSIVNEPSSSISSPIDEDPQARTTACSSTCSSVDCVPSGIDNHEWRLVERESQTSEIENADKKPSKSYREIIIDILRNSPTKLLTAAQIAQSIRDQYSYYRENYSEQAMLNGIYPTLSKRFNKTGVINGQALWSTEDTAADASIVEESTSELPKTYRYQIEEALKSSGPMTSMEISQFICEKYPTKWNAYDLRQRFSSCLFKHFKKTMTNGGITLWSIRSEEEDKHTQFSLESAVSIANVSIDESAQHIVSVAAESSMKNNEVEKSTEKLKLLIEGVLRNSATGVLDYAEISDVIYDQYPGSSIAELNREINTCLSENFEQSFSCDGHPMWSIRTEIQVNAVNTSVESMIPAIDEANTVPTVSHIALDNTIGIDSEGHSKTYKDKIEAAFMNSDNGMLSFNEICEFIHGKYPHSDIAKLKKNVGNRLSDYFHKSVMSNGECLWSMRPEDEAATDISTEESAFSDACEIDFQASSEANIDPTVSFAEDSRDRTGSQRPSKTNREKAEEALRSSKTGQMSSMEITEYINDRYPTDYTPHTLRKSITSTLSKHFKKTTVNGESPLWSMRSENETDSTNEVGNQANSGELNSAPRTSVKRRISSVIDSSATAVPTKRERGASTKYHEMAIVPSIRAYSPEL